MSLEKLSEAKKTFLIALSTRHPNWADNVIKEEKSQEMSEAKYKNEDILSNDGPENKSEFE